MAVLIEEQNEFNKATNPMFAMAGAAFLIGLVALTTVGIKQTFFSAAEDTSMQVEITVPAPGE